MIKQLAMSAALAAGLLTLAACQDEEPAYYSQPAPPPAYAPPPPPYIQPNPPVGFYEGGIYYGNFNDYWAHHRDWDREHAYREWERHPREARRFEERGEHYEHER